MTAGVLPTVMGVESLLLFNDIRLQGIDDIEQICLLCSGNFELVQRRHKVRYHHSEVAFGNTETSVCRLGGTTDDLARPTCDITNQILVFLFEP